MKENEIRQLVKILEESDIGELEVKVTPWGRTIKISKFSAHAPQSANSTTHHVVQTAQQAQTPVASPEKTASNQSETEEKTASHAGWHEIKSPMVGTFYRSPAPDADPYVQVGQTVKKGQVLCIIEAMKLMNEIESEIDGKIVEIHAENSQPVEYNQALFTVEPA